MLTIMYDKHLDENNNVQCEGREYNESSFFTKHAQFKKFNVSYAVRVT